QVIIGSLCKTVFTILITIHQTSILTSPALLAQTNAGAVMLTDCVFWFIIFPFLTVKDYSMNFLLIGMHSVNAVFLLGEASLNSLVSG
uniref:Uncharacterized protein n=1 Tax=Aegilops tauschii subsp. strangulata TaxID=200361 RepID=A0A453N534_AEGTS